MVEQSNVIQFGEYLLDVNDVFEKISILLHCQYDISTPYYNNLYKKYSRSDLLISGCDSEKSRKIIKGIKEDVSKLLQAVLKKKLLSKNNGEFPKSGWDLEQMIGAKEIYSVTDEQNILFDFVTSNNGSVGVCSYSGMCRVNSKYVNPDNLDPKVALRLMVYEIFSHGVMPEVACLFNNDDGVLDLEKYNAYMSEYNKLRSKMLEEKTLPVTYFQSYPEKERKELLAPGSNSKYRKILERTLEG